MQLELDYYEAVNLHELLLATASNGPLPMDTGDWHGQARWKLEKLIEPGPPPGMRREPNEGFAEMRARAFRAALYRALKE